LQLLRAGKIPFLQGAQTIPTLQKLVEYKLLPPSDAQNLVEAYFFLRDIEHRLQMENNQQTHTIPIERKARARLAALMGFDSLEKFESARKIHTSNVRRIYEHLLQEEKPDEAQFLPGDFENESAQWKQLLTQHSFKDAEKAFHLIKNFGQGPGYVHVSSRTTELARELLPKFFGLCPNVGVPASACQQRAKARTPTYLSDPDRVLARLDSFIAAYGARATLYETWTSNPSLFELLLLLFDRSEFLAEMAIRTPDLVDELELSGRLRRQKNSDEILKDLRHGLGDEDQFLWLRRYHQAELMRIGLRDILGLADFEHDLTELSELADASLQYAVDVVLK
ncbi:MAG: hypothetical protein ACR2H1_03800, partial [Limisphaerales bacterium]